MLKWNINNVYNFCVWLSHLFNHNAKRLFLITLSCVPCMSVLYSSSLFNKRHDFHRGRIIHSFICFKKAYYSVRRMGGWLYNILIEFDFTTKMARVCMNATYSRFWVGIHLSHMIPIMNGSKKRCFITTSYHLCFTVHHSVGSGELDWLEIKCYISASCLC